jgi:hypothetical protein
VALGLVLGGCAVPIRIAAIDASAPRDLTPIAIDAGLSSIEDPATKARLARLLATPDMREIERQLIAGVVDGSLATMSEKERVERVNDLTSRYAAGVLRMLASEFVPQAREAASEALKGAVDGAFDEAMSERHQRVLTRFASSLAEASVRPIADQLSTTHLASGVSSAMTQQIGPALQTVLRENLALGVADALLDERVQRALGTTARNLSRETILGSNEGLSQIQATRPANQPSWIDRGLSLATEGAQIASAITWFLALIALALAIWIVKLLLLQRRHRIEIDRLVPVSPPPPAPPAAPLWREPGAPRFRARHFARKRALARPSTPDPPPGA